MAITITPNIQPVSAPSAPASAAGVLLQPGQVITAQVVQILGNDQVQIAIGGQTIEAATQVPLQVGQSLQLQVSQTPGGIGLAIVNQPSAAASQASAGGAATSDAITLAPSLAASLAAATTPATSAPGSPLTPAETLAVTLAAQTAATQQTSLAQLFANLDVAAGLGLPPQILGAVAQVLAQQTNLDQNLTGSAVKQAFQSSGLFLESTIAAGSGLSSNGGLDLKAALIVLRQVLSASLVNLTGETAAPAVASQPGATIPQASTPANPAAAAAPAAGPASEPAATGSTSTPATADTTRQAATPASAQAEQATGQASALPVTIIGEVVTQEALAPSPSIVPQAGSTVGSPAASAQTTAQAVVQEILELATANLATASAAVPADVAARTAASSAALNLLQEVLQASPFAAASPSQFVFENSLVLSLLPAVAGVRTLTNSDPEIARTNLPPPPVSGALPSAQPVAPATLSARAPLETTLQQLLSDTDGAIARQTLLQIASLPGQTDPSANRADAAMPRWNFEIPFATPRGTAMAQFEISRDGGGRDVEGAKQVWRARFSLDVEPAGPVHALVSLNGDRTSVRMWAERPATASQLRAGVSTLTQALSRAELTPGEIVVRDGAPSQATPAVPGHFLDRAS
jgi:hypothetical protein